MKKILFITNRNILTSSGELRLIKNRAEALFSEYGIASDFLAMSSKERIQSKKKESIRAGGQTKTYELALYNPITSFCSYSQLKNDAKDKLATDQYGAVILSGPLMPILAKYINKNSGVPVYLDIHGALEDIIEVSRKASGLKSIILRTLFFAEKLSLKKAVKYCNGFFVVTEALKEYLVRQFRISDDKVFYTVPCATSTIPIDVCEYQKDRENYRNKYKIQENELVFVYSGGVSVWQCVEETIELYKRIADSLDVSSRLLVFSHNIEEIKSLAKGDERIITDSYPPDELFHALRAGDFAFLLRKNNPTNNVAFPNKFLEYVQSGMRIITTPHVEEIAKQVTQNKLGYIYDFDKDISELLKYIASVDSLDDRIEIIDAVLKSNSFITTTRSFAEGFRNGTTEKDGIQCKK